MRLENYLCTGFIRRGEDGDNIIPGNGGSFDEKGHTGPITGRFLPIIQTRLLLKFSQPNEQLIGWWRVNHNCLVFGEDESARGGIHDDFLHNKLLARRIREVVLKDVDTGSICRGEDGGSVISGNNRTRRMHAWFHALACLA